jgi:peptide chain release factor 1
MNNDRLRSLLEEHADLERRLADPAIHSDQAEARRVGRRYAELSGIAKTSAELDRVLDDLAVARELAPEDPLFAAEATELADRVPHLEQRLSELLMPRDPNDAKDVLFEIKAGEGGEESALFAGDLLRMYQRYAERRGWVFEVLDVQESDLGGLKDIAVAIRTRVFLTKAWRLVPAEVGGRRPPGAAGAGHRVAGPNSYQRGRGTGDSGG